MAQYFFDPNDFPTGPAVGWTILSDNSSLLVDIHDPEEEGGGRVLRLRKSWNSRNHHAFLDSVPDSSDAEIVGRARHSATFNDAPPLLVLAASDSDPGSGYSAGLYNTSSLRISRAGATIAQVNCPPIPAHTWYRLHFKKEGSRLTLSLTVDDTTHSVSTTDSTFTSGRSGVTAFNSTSFFDWIGVGTDGDPAPMEPVGEEEPIHFSALSAATTASDARLTRRAGLAATSESVSAATGEPVRRIGAAATTATNSSATGLLARPVHLSAESVTTTGASLQASTAILLRATAAAKTGAEAALTRQILTTGESSTTGAVDASLSRVVRASSESVSHTAAVGALDRSIQLSATSSTATAASLQVDSSIRLAAVATVTTSTSAGLTRRIQPTGITEATSGASATLARRVRMSSRTDTYTVAIADVLRAIRMVGSARAASAAHATLSVGDPLPHPTTLGVTIDDIYTLGVTIEDIYTLAAIIED